MKNLLLFKTILCVCVTFFSNVSLLACSCAWDVPDHFCRSVSESNHIVLAVVTEKPEWYAMDVKIIDNLNLQTDSDTITVLGQDGFNCGEWLEDFLIGDTLILAVDNGEFYEVMTNDTYNWFLGNCGLYYLRYTDGMVLGDVDFGEELISYLDFSEGIENCMDLSSSTDDHLAEIELNISPNPALNYIDVNFENDRGVEYLFDILDVSGRVLKKDIIVNASDHRISLDDISPGVYFLRSRNTSELVAKKFIKI